MDKNTKAFMMQLNDNELFQQHIRLNVVTEMPLIPRYSCKQDNTEEWKAASYRREGFELALMTMGIKYQEK